MKKVVLKLIKLAILQPSYIPWIGYFEQIMNVDKFIFYDDVQYTKNDWRNRNRIKTHNDVSWLSIPIKHKSLDMLICDTLVDDTKNWRKKHIKSLIQYYKQSEYFSEVFPILEQNISSDIKKLSELNINIIKDLSNYLGFSTEFYLSSKLNIHGEKSERLIKICKYFNANFYYSGAAAKEYLNENLFKEEEIKFSYQNYTLKEYKQLYSNEFSPYLSIIDLLFNYGKNSIEIIKGK